MKHVALGALLLFATACGSSDSPTGPSTTQTTVTPPLQSALLVTVGQLSTPGCDALISLGASLGFATANCKEFTGLLQNQGTGCAGNVRGTTVLYYDAAGTNQASAAGWTYSGIVKPGEQIVYTGGVLSVPTHQWYWRTTPAWDSVRCQ